MGEFFLPQPTHYELNDFDFAALDVMGGGKVDVAGTLEHEHSLTFEM